jgi:type II secretory pathway pseudopilin PulG
MYAVEMTKLFFNKRESLGIILILLFIFSLSTYNYFLSLRRARDTQRRDDLTALAGALESYYNDFDRYPLSTSDGKLIACLPEGWTSEDMKDLLGGQPIKYRDRMFANLAPCKWGKSSLADVSDDSKELYLSIIPHDSRASDGFSYQYFSTGKHFQIYGAFEGKSNLEYSEAVVNMNISCGVKTCNFGKASRGTPLDKILNEYENELLDK